MQPQGSEKFGAVGLRTQEASLWDLEEEADPFILWAFFF